MQLSVVRGNSAERVKLPSARDYNTCYFLFWLVPSSLHAHSSFTIFLDTLRIPRISLYRCKYGAGSASHV